MLLCGMGISAQQPVVKGDCDENLLKGYPDSLDYLAYAHRLDEGMALADSLLSIYGHLNCPDVILIKAERANIYEKNFDFTSAIGIYNKQVLVAQKFNFVEVEVRVRIPLALCYELVGRPKLCKEELDKAFELITAHQLYQYLPEYYVRNSSYHRAFRHEEKSKAVELANKAVEWSKKYGKDRELAEGYLMLGILTDDAEAAILYFKQASHILYQIGDYILAMYQERNIASNYVNLGEFQKALGVLDNIDLHLINYPGQKKAYYQMQWAIIDVKAKAYEGLGQKDSVINLLKDYNKYSRLLQNYVNQEKINQLVVDNIVQREQEKTTSAKKQNRILFFGIALLSGIALLLLRLYLSNKEKARKINNQTLTISQNFAELQKLYDYQSTLLSEVHHRIKNNLQLIISLMTLQKAKMGDAAERTFLDVLSHRISSIALIHEQLYSLKEFKKVDVSLYSTALLNNLITLTPNSDVQIENKVGRIHLNLETITPLGLIWSELISNSLKYNRNKTGLRIYFELKQEGESYFMHYHDNGKGYQEGKFMGNTKGIGYIIIQSLSRQLAAETQTYNSEGAHFTMMFKEKQISSV